MLIIVKYVVLFIESKMSYQFKYRNNMVNLKIKHILKVFFVLNLLQRHKRVGFLFS